MSEIKKNLSPEEQAQLDALLQKAGSVEVSTNNKENILKPAQTQEASAQSIQETEDQPLKSLSEPDSKTQQVETTTEQASVEERPLVDANFLASGVLIKGNQPTENLKEFLDKLQQ